MTKAADTSHMHGTSVHKLAQEDFGYRHVKRNDLIRSAWAANHCEIAVTIKAADASQTLCSTSIHNPQHNTPVQSQAPPHLHEPFLHSQQLGVPQLHAVHLLAHCRYNTLTHSGVQHFLQYKAENCATGLYRCSDSTTWAFKACQRHLASLH